MAVTAPVPPTPPSAPAPPQAVTAAPAVGSGADAPGFGTTVTTQDADSAAKHTEPQRPAAPAGRPESHNGQDKDTSSGQQSSSAGGLTMTTADDGSTSSASVQSSSSVQPSGLPTDGHPLVYWPFAVLLLLAAIVLGIRVGHRHTPARRPPASRGPKKGTKTGGKSHFEIRI